MRFSTLNAACQGRVHRRRRRLNWPISVYRLGEMPIQSCGQSVSARRVKAGAGLNAHTELWVKRQRSARETIYRNRLIGSVFEGVRRDDLSGISLIMRRDGLSGFRDTITRGMTGPHGVGPDVQVWLWFQGHTGRLHDMRTTASAGG